MIVVHVVVGSSPIGRPCLRSIERRNSPIFYMDSLITLDINSIGILVQAVNFVVLGVLGVAAFYMLRFFVRIMRYIQTRQNLESGRDAQGLGRVQSRPDRQRNL